MAGAAAAEHDGDMNETSTGPQTPPGPATPDQDPPRPAIDDLDRLRRSVEDRYVAGVAGGIGRYYRIDPTLVRVLFAVLAFFGGAGVVIYGACWLLIPEEHREEATVTLAPDVRRLVLIVVGVLAALMAVGDAFSGFHAGWPFAAVAVVLVVVLLGRRRDRRLARTFSPGEPGPAAAGPTAPGTMPSGSPTGPAPAAGEQPAGPGASPEDPTQGSVQGPGAPGAPTGIEPGRPWIPPRPKRTGVIWFWPTLALIAIGLGTLGVIDSANGSVPATAYPALALGIAGVMLVVGSVFGRPGGLIAVGLLSALALAVGSAAGGFRFNAEEVDHTPVSAAAVSDAYSISNGRLTLDLTEVRDPEALAGRALSLDLRAGEIRVLVPRSLNLDLHAKVGFAGGITLPGYDGGGFRETVDRSVSGTDSTASPLDLTLEVRVGQITVEQR